jgi:hypothetical protein
LHAFCIMSSATDTSLTHLFVCSAVLFILKKGIYGLDSRNADILDM